MWEEKGLRKPKSCAQTVRPESECLIAERDFMELSGSTVLRDFSSPSELEDGEEFSCCPRSVLTDSGAD